MSTVDQSRCNACAAPVPYGNTTCPACGSDLSPTGSATFDFRRDGETILRRLGFGIWFRVEGEMYYEVDEHVGSYYIFESSDILNVICVENMFDFRNGRKRTADQLMSLARQLNAAFPMVKFLFEPRLMNGLTAMYESVVETEAEFVVFVRCAAQLLAAAEEKCEECVNAA